MHSGVEKRHLVRLITLRPTFDSWPRNNSASDMPFSHVLCRTGRQFVDVAQPVRAWDS